MRILLTAFEPFLGEKINPSMKMLSHFANDPEISTAILPVSYKRAFESLKPTLEEGHFTDVIMLGQAAGRSKVSMERFAMNWQDAEYADEDGEIRLEQIIETVGRGSYRTTYPLRTWLNEAQKQNHPLEISLSAGAFICNTIYYQLAHWGHQHRPGLRCMFVHVPFLPEQVVGKNPTPPSMTESEMLNSVKFILENVKRG